MTIKLFGRSTSYNVQKALWLLEELELQYEHIQCGGKYGGLDNDEFAAMNPMQKVPVVSDGDDVIWESNTILRYLASKYGDNHWIPTDPYQRSLCERWMDWCLVTFEPAFIGVFWGYYRTPEEQRNLELINKSKNDCLDCLDKLNNQLANDHYIVGPKLSLADITAGVFIYRLVEVDLKIPLPDHVSRWYDRLQLREGYKKWVMSDFTELKGRLAY